MPLLKKKDKEEALISREVEQEDAEILFYSLDTFEDSRDSRDN